MVKKLLTIIMGLGLAVSASATINFSASDIQYWVGTGSNQAVVVIAWDDYTTPTAYAWGVRWNGSVSALDLIDSIQAYDSRFHNGSTATVASATYTENGVTLTSDNDYWCYTVNGQWATVGYTGYTMSNGDIMEISGSCMFTMTTAVAATDPNPTPAEPTPVEATIAASDILYWEGEGSNEAVLAVNWADTALAWGYRFGTDSVSVQQVMDAIAAADPRFSWETGSWGLGDILFVLSAGDTLRGVPGSYWESKLNGITDMGMSQMLGNGDFEKWAEPAAGVVTDSSNWGGVWYYTYTYPMTIHPVGAPAPEEATIAASAIEYWVGEGTNQAVLAVNWPDTALAWGYRWNNSATVADMLNAVAAADPRFSIVPGSYGIDDILFVENGDTLRRLATSWWGSTNNGVMDMGMGQTLVDGDFEKWADGTTGVLVDSVWVEDWGGYWNQIYVYPMTIHAASQPFGYGPFSGIVGTEGCEAIAYNSSDIKAWATTCTLVRGSQNLSNPEAPVVTYGTEQDAVGAASSNNMAVVSLGDGGTATLTFAKPIANGDGPDFAVFENSFDDYFLELAFVEVSSDGERFVRFPATSLTQTARQIGGTGRVDATYINNLAGKYRVGYGTPFDLAELADSTGLDINAVTHVRIVDAIGSIDPQYATYDAFGHMVNDPFPTTSYSAGFDLDGVAVLHEGTVGVDEVALAGVSLYPNPVSDRLTISGAEGSEAALYDMTGRLMGSWQVTADSWQLGTSDLKAGVYMLRVGGNTYRIVKK
ncbi:MAG: T9SS type A sorting domain-containing protein [Bacteroidales bacterium]|nr:T9SS type A sorting domain-containing protein [Bacteroidales bacterium]